MPPVFLLCLGWFLPSPFTATTGELSRPGSVQFHHVQTPTALAILRQQYLPSFQPNQVVWFDVCRDQYPQPPRLFDVQVKTRQPGSRIRHKNSVARLVVRTQLTTFNYRTHILDRSFIQRSQFSHSISNTSLWCIIYLPNYDDYVSPIAQHNTLNRLINRGFVSFFLSSLSSFY